MKNMIFGSQYYRPPFPSPDNWERDFSTMKQHGFNTVKLWVVWNWIEKEKGKFDFAEIDKLVALAKKHELQVVLNTITEGAPWWAYDEVANALYETANGLTITPGGPANIPTGGWPGFCWDSEQACKLMENFIYQTSLRYKDNQSVIAIDVWNEPHLEPTFDYRSELFCYCEHSVKEFRKWLKTRYSSLDVLNKTWIRTYEDWSQVLPPPRFGTWTDMIDWRLFWIQNLRRWLRLRVSAARRGAPNKIIQTHVAYSGTLGNKMEGGIANELGDEFSLVHEVDVFGLTGFPMWLMGSNHMYVHFAHNEIVAEASGSKPFYQVELQGGGGKKGLLGGEVPGKHDINVWNWNTIAAGGKGVLYWQYAAEPAGLESPGFGLVNFEGELSERFIAASQCAKTLNNKEIFDSKRIPASNAIYISRLSQVLCFASGRNEHLYAGSVNGIYKSAYHNGIPVRFFHQDNIENLLREKVKSLYLPMTLILSKREVDILEEFVLQGGTLVGESFTGAYNEHGILDERMNALQKLFGVKHYELQATPDWGPIDILLNDGRILKGTQYRHLIKAQKGTETLATFPDGQVAMTKSVKGKGKAIFIGSFASLQYNNFPDMISGKILTKDFDLLGYEHLTDVTFYNKAPVIRLLESDKSLVIVLVNHYSERIDYNVEVMLDSGNTKKLTGTLDEYQGKYEILYK